jgi:hypothetical protein
MVTMADMAFHDSRVELLARTSVPATDYARHKGAPVQNPRLETARVGRVGLKMLLMQEHP